MVRGLRISLGGCHLAWHLVVIALMATIFAGTANAGDLNRPSTDETLHAGYRYLIEKAYVPASLDQEVFDNLWRSWEEPLKTEAEKATAEQRRDMTLSRYGLTDAPGRVGGVPMQFALDGKGGWALNCFTCHGDKLNGQLMPGLPNTHIALQTLTQEIVATKKLLGRDIEAAEGASLFVPLGGSNGTTNAIIFGVVLGAMRDPDLNVNVNAKMPKLVHNDHDAPPWWNVKYKKHLYADGFAGKGHRALMQFMMTPSNGPEFFHQNEHDFKDVLAWIESLEPPKYPYTINHELAQRGEGLFNQTCSECHGTYGENAQWPEKNVPLSVVGTDSARWESLTPEMRGGYSISWFSNYGEKHTIADPDGYVAQPLNGIWASAPYLHNGSVPTLWHLFNPAERPVVWKRTETGYDQQKLGIEVETYSELPPGVKRAKDKRQYFDTRLFGKSAVGHTFPDELSADEKVAVMEYLKTL